MWMVLKSRRPVHLALRYHLGKGHCTLNYSYNVQNFLTVYFHYIKSSTLILRFFRTVHYPLKIIFDITLWLISNYFWLSFFQVKWQFSTSVTAFQVHLNFSTSARTFQLQRNFPTSAKLSDFARFFPTSQGSFQLKQKLSNYRIHSFKIFEYCSSLFTEVTLGQIWGQMRSSEVIENRTFFQK